MGSAVYAGNRRKHPSLPSFLLQVIIGTTTIPGGLLLVDSQTTDPANHSFPTPSCLLFTCMYLSSPARTHSLISNYSLLNNSFLFVNSTLYFGNLSCCFFGILPLQMS